MSEEFENVSTSTESTDDDLSRLRRMLELSRNGSFQSNEEEDDYIFDDPRLRLSLLILYSLVFGFCFLGNLTVVLVTKLHWKMRGVPRFCLGNLAFANLCVSVFCIYQNLSLYLMDSWIFGDLMCKMYHFINSLSHTASILILVVIAVERYLAILQPLKCRRILTTRRLRLVIVGVWIGSALLVSPRLYYIIIIKNILPRRRGEPLRYEVICSIGSSLFDSRAADWMQFLLLFLLPILIITILYTRIALSLGQRRNFRESFHSSSADRFRSDLQSHAVSDIVSGAEEVSPQEFNLNSRTNTSTENTSRISERKKRQSIKEAGKKCGGGRGAKSAVEGRPECEVKSDENSQDISRRARKRSALKISRYARFLHPRCPYGGSKRMKRSVEGSRREKADKVAASSRHAGVVRMLVLIVVTFAICNLPFHLRKLYQHHLYARKGDSVWTELSAPFTFLLMYANCALNPFLYAFMSKSFRSCTLDLVKCKLRKPSYV